MNIAKLRASVREARRAVEDFQPTVIHLAFFATSHWVAGDSAQHEQNTGQLFRYVKWTLKCDLLCEAVRWGHREGEVTGSDLSQLQTRSKIQKLIAVK